MMNKRAIRQIWDFLEAEGPNGSRVRLDINEATVLLYLLRREPAVVSLESMAKAVFGDKSKTGTVGTYVMRLRRKLGEGRILTIRGRGYRMGAA